MIRFRNAQVYFKIVIVICAYCLLGSGVSGCGSSGLDNALGLTTISTFSPTSGTSGTVVTVVGTNLGGSGAVVIIHGILVGNVSGSDTSILFAIPANVPTGANTITVNGVTAGVFTDS